MQNRSTALPALTQLASNLPQDGGGKSFPCQHGEELPLFLRARPSRCSPQFLFHQGARCRQLVFRRDSLQRFVDDRLLQAFLRQFHAQHAGASRLEAKSLLHPLAGVREVVNVALVGQLPANVFCHLLTSSATCSE